MSRLDISTELLKIISKCHKQPSSFLRQSTDRCSNYTIIVSAICLCQFSNVFAGGVVVRVTYKSRAPDHRLPVQYLEHRYSSCTLERHSLF